ncbi:MAG TPA: hypothetical protein VNL98_02605 [Gemmatimonadales bacterium]|nr:hypothetical protein [Gemmatimonadales bacterium]
MPDSLFVLAGVWLGADSAAVRRLLGTPAGITTDAATETLGYTFTTWTYPELTVTFADSAVAYVTCTHGSCKLPNGIGIGMSRRAVEGRLGPPAVLPRREPPDRASYVGRASDCGITIEYRDDRVLALRLWCDYS